MLFISKYSVQECKDYVFFYTFHLIPKLFILLDFFFFFFYLSVEAIHLDIYNFHEMNVSSCKFNKKVFILKASLSVLSIRVGIRSFVYFMPINWHKLNHFFKINKKKGLKHSLILLLDLTIKLLLQYPIGLTL